MLHRVASSRSSFKLMHVFTIIVHSNIRVTLDFVIDSHCFGAFARIFWGSFIGVDIAEVHFVAIYIVDCSGGIIEFESSEKSRKIENSTQKLKMGKLENATAIPSSFPKVANMALVLWSHTISVYNTTLNTHIFTIRINLQYAHWNSYFERFFYFFYFALFRSCFHCFRMSE